LTGPPPAITQDAFRTDRVLTRGEELEYFSQKERTSG